MKTFFITAGAVAQMVEQQNYFSLQANKVPMNPNCVSQVRVLSAPQNNENAYIHVFVIFIR
jgi:hypothetical protein